MANVANTMARIAIEITPKNGSGDLAKSHAKRAAKIPAIILRIISVAPHAAGRVIVADC